MDENEFKKHMIKMNSYLIELNEEASKIEAEININLKELFGD